MKSKLIILLALASLAQGAYRPTLTVDYGLSKEQADVLYKILLTQELTVTMFFNAFDDFFRIFSDVDVETNERSCKLADVLVGVRAAVKILGNLDVLILGNSCSATVELALKAADADFEAVFCKHISTALELARSGNCARNQAAIEIQHAAAQKDYKNLIDMEYGVIRTCLNTTDPGILAVIESAWDGSLVSAVHSINGIFNAIKVYAAAVPGMCGDLTSTFDIQDIKGKIRASTLSYLEYKFSTLRALWINSCLNESGIMFGVFRSQYTECVSFLEYMEGNNDFFLIATRYLRRIQLGLYADNNPNAFSATNVTLARIGAYYDVGDKAILDFILFIHPDFSSKISTAQKYLHALDAEFIIAVINAFDLAAARDKNHSEILDYIAAFKKAIVPPVRDFTQYVFDLIWNNRTFDHQTEATLKTLQNVALNGIEIYTVKFFDAAVILANASHTGVVSEDDYSAIQVLQDEANGSLDGFTQGITAAGLLVYRFLTRI